MTGTDAFNLVWDFRAKTALYPSDPAFLADDFMDIVTSSNPEAVDLAKDFEGKVFANASRTLLSRIDNLIVKNNRRIAGLKDSMHRHLEDRTVEDCWEWRIIKSLDHKNYDLYCDVNALKQAIKVFES